MFLWDLATIFCRLNCAEHWTLIFYTVKLQEWSEVWLLPWLYLPNSERLGSLYKSKLVQLQWGFGGKLGLIANLLVPSHVSWSQLSAMKILIALTNVAHWSSCGTSEEFLMELLSQAGRELLSTRDVMMRKISRVCVFGLLWSLICISIDRYTDQYVI